MALPVKKGYSGSGVSTTLTSSPTNGDTTFTVTAVTNWPNTYPFFIVVDPGTTKEEKMKVTGVSSLTVTVVRGQDNTNAVGHTSGAVCYPVFTALEASEANDIASAMTTKGDIITTDGTDINRLAVGTNAHVLQADSTATNGIKWGTVTANGIATDAVTTAKILNSNVTTEKIADSAVTAAKIADSAVTASKIASAVAGNGLSGGAGSALAVNVDDSTLEINSDSLRIKDAGVTLAKLASAVQNLLVPVGTITAYAGTTAPAGWLMCDGTSTSGYTTLAGLVGATTPDLRGHTLVGKGSAPFDGALFSKLGSTTSTAAHTHSITHDHASFDTTGGEGSHSHTGTAQNAGDHNHPVPNDELTAVADHGHGVGSQLMAGSGSSPDGDGLGYTSNAGTHGHTLSIDANGAHNHSINVPEHVGTSGPSSAASAHGNVQPSALVNYIIKHD